MHYYDRTRPAREPWTLWVVVLFMTALAWIVGQLVFTGPLGPMLAELDPEAAAQSEEAMMAAMGDPGVAGLLVLGGFGIIFGTLIGVVALLIHFLGRRGRASMATGLIGVGLFFAGLVPFLLANSSMSEEAGAVMSVIGMSPLAYLLVLLTFPAVLVGLYWGWKAVLERPILSLHTVFERFSWGRTAQAFAIGWIVLGGFTLGATLLGLASPEYVLDATRFASFAVVSILFLPIQSAVEEIAVRGFMNKGLIRFLGNKWVAFTLTSGLFMALHLANPEAKAGADAGALAIVMSGYFFFGFAACLMVLIDDGLESAIGIHAANNTFAAIFVNYEGSVLPTPSVWRVTPDATGDSISTILVLLCMLGALWVTRKPWLERRRAELPPRQDALAEHFA